MKYSVSDTGTTLNFEGVLLAHSSSRGREPRWVEFTLYRAARGQYVIERVGKSVQYHRRSCNIVGRNNLSRVHPAELPTNYVPCDLCRPSRVDPEGIFPEKDRPWFVTCDSAEGVVRSLERVDKHGSHYLTNVVKNLLSDASKLDRGIYDNFVVQTLK